MSAVFLYLHKISRKSNSYYRQERPPAVSAKDVAAIKPSATPSAPDGEPGGDSGQRQTGLLPPSCQPLQLPTRAHPEGPLDWEKQDISQVSQSALHKNDFNEPSIFQKTVLNSLTWAIWFSFTNSHLLMLRPPEFCCRNSYSSWLLPDIFRAVPQHDLPGCFPGLRLPNKT